MNPIFGQLGCHQNIMFDGIMANISDGGDGPAGGKILMSGDLPFDVIIAISLFHKS